MLRPNHKKKEINPLYYDRILNNLKQAKIILFILLFAIFIVLINPIKMLSIFNVNIYSILTDQYPDIIKIVKTLGDCDNKFKYIEKKTNLGVLDKTIKEIIMNTKSEDVYKRILIEMPGTNKKTDLCNLINSIDLENKLSHLDENKFRKIKDKLKYSQADLELDGNNLDVYTLLNQIKNENNGDNGNITITGLTLDTTQYKKFENFNKIIKETFAPIDSPTDNVNLVFITLLTFYYVFELLYEIHSFIISEKKDITQKLTIIAAGNNEAVNTATIIFNIFIFIILLRILNDKKWLNETGLSTINTNKYIPLLLFTSNIICKIYFKYSKYITFDSFLFIKIISIISNSFGLGLVIKYIWPKLDELFQLPYLEFISLIFPIFVIVTSLYLLNINYYDRKIAKNTDMVSLTPYSYKLKYNSKQETDISKITHMGQIDFTWYGIHDGALYYPLSALIILYNIGVSGFAAWHIYKKLISYDITQKIFLLVCFIIQVVLSLVPFLGELNGQDFFATFGVPKGENEGPYKKIIVTLILFMTGNILIVGSIAVHLLKETSSQNVLPELMSIFLALILNISWLFVVKANDSRTKNLIILAIFTFILLLSTINRYYLNPTEEKTGLLARQGGGGAINNSSITENKISNIVKYIIIGLSCMLLYKLYINYKKEVNQTKIKHTKEINGGMSDNDPLVNMANVTYNIKPTDIIDGQIIQLVIALVILILLYVFGMLQTNDLSNFIQDQVFASSNLNILRLLFFPFIIIAIISIIGGRKFFKSLIIRHVEKNSIGNFDSDPDTMNLSEKKLIDNNSNNFIDKKNSSDELLSAYTIRIAKYTFLAFIIIWYLFLLFRGRIALSPILLINISIIVIYVYFIINVIYMFYKIYMNENVNNISAEIAKLSEIKDNIKFRKGKINPELLSEIIEINTDKFKDKYEQFIFEMYKNVYDLLSVNNIYLTEHIANYIKIKLIKHKTLEDEFSLVNSKAEKTSTQNPIKLDINGKWINRKNKNNIILYVYNNKVGIVIYLNETSYNNMKMIDVVFKDSTYEFFSENKLLFTYTDEKIMLNDIEYTRLSNEFSTDNIIKKTLADNDVFKNLNYMVSIDKDSKFIGKYNLVENLTTYNVYKNNGDPLATELEEIILNKVLLIKAIRDKKYKEAEEFNSKLNVLESTFKKKMMFNKFDSNLDGTIDFNEIGNYVGKNYKLSEPNSVKIKSAIFDGANLIIQFDKEITTNENSFKSVTTANEEGEGTDIDLETIFKLRINDEDSTDPFIDNQINTFNGSTLYESIKAGGKTYFNIENRIFKENVPYIKLLTVQNPSDPTLKKGEDTNYTQHTDNILTKNNKLQLTPVSDTDKYQITKHFETTATATKTSKTFFINYKNITYQEIKLNGSDLDYNIVHSNNSNIEILNKDTLKIKLKEDIIQKLNTFNNIKLYIADTSANAAKDIYIQVRQKANGVNKRNRTLKKSLVKIHKTINNFEEFDNSIFGT